MVAQLTINFPFFGRREVNAVQQARGSGECKEGNSNADVGISQKTGNTDDDEQAE
jgi:hypothetical protein